MPVLVIAQEESFAVSVQCGVQEQAYQLEVSHFFEPAVGSLYGAAHDSKVAPRHLLAQQVIFRIQYLLVKSSKRVESSPVEEHVHACAERFVKARELLHEVIAVVECPIPGRALGAHNVCGNAVKIPSLG